MNALSLMTVLKKHTIYFVLSDCLHFGIFFSLNEVPNCEPFAYDQPAVGAWFCFIKCIDMPYCRHTFYNNTQRNCTYHACSDVVSKETNVVLYTKKCYSGISNYINIIKFVLELC